MKVTLELELPDNSNVKLSEYDLKMHLGVKLYEDGLVSTGFVASMIGMTRRHFLENMGTYGGILFKGTEEEFKKDAEIAGQFVR